MRGAWWKAKTVRWVHGRCSDGSVLHLDEEYERRFSHSFCEEGGGWVNPMAR